MTAAMLGTGWESALTNLSRAAGARGVALIRNRRKRLVGAITNADIAEPVADFLTGQGATELAPDPGRSSRRPRLPGRSRRLHARPNSIAILSTKISCARSGRSGMPMPGWSMSLATRLRSASSAISWQGLTSGPTRPALNTTLNEIRAAVRVAHRVLDAEALGMARMLHRRGDPVFELDGWGHVLRVHAVADEDELPLTNRGPKARRTRPNISSKASISPSGRRRPCAAPPRRCFSAPPASATFCKSCLSTGLGARCLPVDVGDCGCAATAQQCRRAGPGRASPVGHLRLHGSREAKSPRCFLQGMPVDEIAQRLGIGVNTARFHLKGLFREDRNRPPGRACRLARTIAGLISRSRRTEPRRWADRVRLARSQKCLAARAVATATIPSLSTYSVRFAVTLTSPGGRSGSRPARHIPAPAARSRWPGCEPDSGRHLADASAPRGCADHGRERRSPCR